MSDAFSPTGEARDGAWEERDERGEHHVTVCYLVINNRISNRFPKYRLLSGWAI